MDDTEVIEALNTIFHADTGIYQRRGFQRKVGFGRRPALVHIDLANAWTQPGHAFSCDHMDVIIPAVQRLNDAGRAKGIPIVYTTTAYEDVAGPNSDMGLWVHKIPVELLKVGTEAVAIDDRIKPGPGELVIVKKRASGFHGTNLSSYLNAQGVDTVIVTGVTMAGCVRHSVEDAIAEGFRPIVVREAVGDRVPGVVEWNLFDIDAKFGDVEPLSRCWSTSTGSSRSRAAPASLRSRPSESDDRSRPGRELADRPPDGPRRSRRCALGGMGRSRRARTSRWSSPPGATTTAGPCGSALPLVDGDGTPVAFLDVHVPAHLAFYRAGIAAITDEDPYAGLLVSMHGTGIYRQRYGTDTGLSLSRAAEVQPLVDAFVEEQESGYAARMQAAGVDDEHRWADYYRLQWYDRFSLAFCLREWDRPDGASFDVGEYRFSPLGPWRAQVAPYPFAGQPSRFGLRAGSSRAPLDAGGVPSGLPRRRARGRQQE